MEKQFWIIVDIELGQAVCSKKTGKTLTFKSELDAHYEISVGLLSSLDEYMAIEVKANEPIISEKQGIYQNLLISYYMEYVKLLSKDSDELIGIAVAHGWDCPAERIEKGAELRKKIEEAQNEILSLEQDKILRTASDKTKSEVFQAMNKSDDDGFDKNGRFQSFARMEEKLTPEFLAQEGFYQLPHFTVQDNWLKSIGRDRFISIGCVGTPNEIIFLTEEHPPKVDNIIVLKNYDFDGYTTPDKLKSIIDLLAEKKPERLEADKKTYEAMAIVAEKEQILSKFIDLINEREPKIRAIVKELEPAITFPDGKGERLMRLLISPADVKQILGIKGGYYEGLSPMPDWDMEAVKDLFDLFDDTNNPES